MDIQSLYRVSKVDLVKAELLLTKCFADDPLYVKLIPDATIRNRLLPELFTCDMTEFYENCDVFAESSELRGLLVVSDETEPYHFLRYYLNEVEAERKTDRYLIHEDPSLATYHNFVEGKEYLDSEWTKELPEERIHIIYLAVDPAAQHHGIAARLIEEALAYADKNQLMVSLETHNPNNVAFYKQFGFEIYETFEKHFNLTQYCLVRPKSIYIGNEE